jgi:hypothetical protein
MWEAFLHSLSTKSCCGSLYLMIPQYQTLGETLSLWISNQHIQYCLSTTCTSFSLLLIKCLFITYQQSLGCGSPLSAWSDQYSYCCCPPELTGSGRPARLVMPCYQSIHFTCLPIIHCYPHHPHLYTCMCPLQWVGTRRVHAGCCCAGHGLIYNRWILAFII